MMKNTELASVLREHFDNQGNMTTSQITDFLNDSFPDLSPSTISWRISQLKKEKLIFQKGRGIYSFEFKPEFTVELSLKTKRLYNRIKPMCNSDLCIWDTIMLNELIDETNEKNWFFFSTAKEELEPLFKNMLDFSKKVFLQPDREVIQRYVLSQGEAIILTPLVSEIPLQKNGEYLTPSIEGILVNAWMKYENYLKPIGYDISNIFNYAFKKYNINKNRLLRYAGRRDKRNEITDLIKTL